MPRFEGLLIVLISQKKIITWFLFETPAFSVMYWFAYGVFFCLEIYYAPTRKTSNQFSYSAEFGREESRIRQPQKRLGSASQGRHRHPQLVDARDNSLLRVHPSLSIVEPLIAFIFIVGPIHIMYTEAKRFLARR